ncbi:MAG: NAD(+)/NADH kinase [Clostridia bacterium]|nr:NAD(+)/NADH kinase [Clostridia bacterium]
MISNIALIPNENKDRELACAKRVAQKITSLEKKVLVPLEYAHYFEKNANIIPLDEAELYKSAELAVVTGGDGSIIHTARIAALYSIPILGINLGRLGYLAELELDETDLLEDILDGSYTLEKRMMLDYKIVKADGETSTAFALNDIVLTSRGNTNRVVDVDIFEGKFGTHVGAFRGDGVIASTPTGSTAYSLAAGGPVIDPMLECISIVPICTHSLMARPMLFSPDTELKLVNAGRTQINVSADGSDEYGIKPGEYVSIKKSKHTALFVRVRKSSFYEVLRKKMAEN